MILAIDGEEIKLGNMVLPGLLQRMAINGTAIVDKQDTVVGLKTTQHHGFQPKDMVIELAVLSTEANSAWDQVEELERAFSYNDKAHKDRPAHYRLSCLHAKARRLKEVSFTGLKTEETNRNDVISVVLTFEEFVPPSQTADTTAVPAASNNADSKTAPAKKPTDGVNVDSPAITGFQASQQ